MRLFTAGYQGLDIGRFKSMLRGHGIETVVDVRRFPLSRKPGFSKKALSRALALSDIRYVHVAALGCPKPVLDGYRADGDWGKYAQAFLVHLEAQRDAVGDLARLAKSSACALVCYEADPNFCHRSFVAEAVAALCGAEVRHISAEAAAPGAAARGG